MVREQIRLRDATGDLATGDLATADGHAANAVHLGATEDRGAWFPKSLAWLIAAADRCTTAVATALTHTTPPPTPNGSPPPTPSPPTATPCCTYTPPTFTPTQEPHP